MVSRFHSADRLSVHTVMALQEGPVNSIGHHAQILANRIIHLAFGWNRAMNGVAMNTFTIDATNNITAFASLEQARAAKIHNAECFGSSQELAQLAASWAAHRPVEIWNSFARVAPFTKLKPVKRFTKRKVAVTRIWEAIDVDDKYVLAQMRERARTSKFKLLYATDAKNAWIKVANSEADRWRLMLLLRDRRTLGWLESQKLQLPLRKR